MIKEIDRIVRQTLISFSEDVVRNNWSGRREREAISLYVFGHLIKQCSAESFLYDATQIGIEVAVPQIDRNTYQSMVKGASSKTQVCKDVILWPRPKMTCWDSKGAPTIYPSAIIEWKYNEGRKSSWDTSWLQTYSSKLSDFVGYAVKIQRRRIFELKCSRFLNGMEDPNWLVV